MGPGHFGSRLRDRGAWPFWLKIAGSWGLAILAQDRQQHHEARQNGMFPQLNLPVATSTSSSSIIIHRHPPSSSSSCIIIHHHPPSSILIIIIIHHQPQSSIIMNHHASPCIIIIHHRPSPSIIMRHPALSLPSIIIHHHAPSSIIIIIIIIHHHASSSITINHHP